MSALVSIIIPTWNRKDLVAECLKSIEAQTYQAFEVIVVDDGSTDGTADYLEENFPYVRVIRMPENRGFCAAVNAGIREASHEYVLLLNNDMTLDRDCIMRLVEGLEVSRADMIAPLVLFRDQPDVVYSVGDRQRANGRPESIGFRCPLSEFKSPGSVFGVSAGAALYRRAVFDKVGLFDERFVAYFEDSDLSFRARLSGFRAWAVCSAKAYHVGSATIQNRTWWRTRQCFRNHALLVLKNMPALLLLRHAPAILAERLHQLARLFSAARAEFGALRALATITSAGFSILAALPHVFRERRRIQQTRTIDLRKLNRLLTGSNGDAHGDAD